MTPAKALQSRASRIAIPVLLLAGAFTLYLSTANPLFRFSDSPEVAAASHCLGVAHPTGYPLYLMAQKLWSFVVPIGNPCFRANLFSALCGAITLVLVYLFASKICGSFAGIVAALLLSFSRTFWLQSTQSTVYALNVMLGLILSLLAWRLVFERASAHRKDDSETGDELNTRAPLRLVALFFFLVGLGLGNHLTLILFPFAAVVSHPGPSLRMVASRKAALTGLAFLLAGLLIYAYLPVRAAVDPPINWDNPSSWERFWDHVSQRDYRFRQASRTTAESLGVTVSFFHTTLEELGVFGVALSLLGFLVLLWTKRRVGLFLLLLVLGALLVALLYGDGKEFELAYCLPAYTALAVMAGVGAAALVSIVRGKQLPDGAPASRTRSRYAVAVSVLLLLVPIGLVSANYHVCDSSCNYYAYWHGLNLLRTMPWGSTFFGETDTSLFPLYYLKFVEKRREDVKLYDRQWRVVDYFETSNPQANYNREMRIIQRAIEPVFYAEYPTVPAINIKLFGILMEAFMAEPRTSTVDFPVLYSEFLDDPPGDVYIDEWTRETRAKYFLLWAHQTQLQGRPDEARERFAKAKELGYESAGLMNNLSIYYEQAGLRDEAISAMERVLELSPGYSRFWSRLGILYYKGNSMEKAVEILQRAVELDDTNADALLYLGNLFLMRKDFGKAEEYFKKILVVMPHHIYAHNNLGFIYKQDGRYDEAIEQFKDAMLSDPGSPKPYYNLASVYALKRDKENVLKWLKKGRRHMTDRFVEQIRPLREFDFVRDDPRFEESLSIDE